jgi:uncharacterized membrane protein
MDTIVTSIIVLGILVALVAGIALQFLKNPAVSVLELIMALAVIAVVVSVFLGLVVWRKRKVGASLL